MIQDNINYNQEKFEKLIVDFKLALNKINNKDKHFLKIMNIGRKIANSKIIGKANSKTKKGLYIQLALSDYFQNQNGELPLEENQKIQAQGNAAIAELKKILDSLQTPINIIRANWGNVAPESACKIRSLLQIESKLHILWDNLADLASDKIKDYINEIEECISDNNKV